MFESLLSFASLATWVQYPFTSLALMLDGIIYSIVSYSYNLFIMMAQLNMNSITEIAGALVDRLYALIMVFVIFRLGMSLISYLIDPSKARDNRIGGVALVKRIIITAAMLLSYNFVFALLNDLSAIIIGTNGNYTPEVIEIDASDSGGLLTRLVFGSNSDGGIAEYGREIAAFTFGQFVRKNPDNSSQNYDEIFEEIKTEDGDFTKVAQLADEVGKTVVYEYPFVSAAVGLFLIYSIVKMAIEIGVRMFKLLVLQMLAPVAIISYIDPASEQKLWKNYTKAYLTTYTDAFIRILAIFLSTAFISAITSNLDTMFGSVSGTNATGMQKMLITVMVIIAGYRFALLLPKFIGGLFGVDLAGDSKGSFGKFMAGLGGLAIGGIAGGVSGLATGLAAGAGFAGTAANMLTGAFSGASSGMKGKGIADKIKKVNESNSRNQGRALNYARMGFGETLLAEAENKLRVPEIYQRKAQPYDDNLALLENVEKAKKESLKGAKDSAGRNIENDSAYMEARRNADAIYQSKLAHIEKMKENPLLATNQNLQKAYNKQMADLKTLDDTYANDLELSRQTVYHSNDGVSRSIDAYKRLHNGDTPISNDLYTKQGMKNAKNTERKAKNDILNNRTMQRHNDRNMFNNK